uniref:Uncharacterized protein n=1 Tax=Arundo donax TaxID=35708 RepID=A0A0A9EPL7_ARUDO
MLLHCFIYHHSLAIYSYAISKLQIKSDKLSD